MTPVNAPIVNGAGQTLPGAANVCGVYRNLGYSILDQEQPGQVIQGPMDAVGAEVFSNYSAPVQPPPSIAIAVDMVNAPYADVLDTVGLFHQATTCLALNENQSIARGFTLQFGGATFPLSLTNNISTGNFNGTLKADVTILTP